MNTHYIPKKNYINTFWLCRYVFAYDDSSHTITFSFNMTLLQYNKLYTWSCYYFLHFYFRRFFFYFQRYFQKNFFTQSNQTFLEIRKRMNFDLLSRHMSQKMFTIFIYFSYEKQFLLFALHLIWANKLFLLPSDELLLEKFELLWEFCFFDSLK